MVFWLRAFLLKPFAHNKRPNELRDFQNPHNKNCDSIHLWGFSLLCVLKMGKLTGIIYKSDRVTRRITVYSQLTDYIVWNKFSYRFCFMCMSHQVWGPYSGFSPSLCRQRRFESKFGKVQVNLAKSHCISVFAQSITELFSRQSV